MQTCACLVLSITRLNHLLDRLWRAINMISEGFYITTGSILVKTTALGLEHCFSFILAQSVMGTS